MDSFEEGSEIKCPKLVTKYQNDSKAEFTGSPFETESDSDSAGEIKGEDKISASSVIYLSKRISNLWQAAKSINYEISQKIFKFLTFVTMNSLFTLENLPL